MKWCYKDYINDSTTTINEIKTLLTKQFNGDLNKVVDLTIDVQDDSPDV